MAASVRKRLRENWMHVDGAGFRAPRLAGQ